MDLSKGIWERRGGAGDLSERAYVAATTLSTAYGLIVTSLLAVYCTSLAPTSFLPFILVGLVVPIIGIFIAHGSENPLVSFLGYNMVVGGLGLITAPVVQAYEAPVVLEAVLATGGVTMAMSLIGIVYPKSLAHWGGWLFAGLIGLILVQFSGIILASFGVAAGEGLMNHPAISYFAVVLFSAYIIFDWNRALRLPYTLDNAIDCSLAIYLDIINLFLHILRIMGGDSNSNS